MDLDHKTSEDLAKRRVWTENSLGYAREHDQRKLAAKFKAVADEVERVVRGAFVYAFDGAMLLCMAMSVASVLAALLVVGKRTQPQRTAGPTPGTEQS